MKHTFQRTLIGSTAFCLLLTINLKSARAQKGEDVVKGLLRALIESQLERSNRGNNQGQTQFDPRRNPASTPGRITPGINQLRPIASSFAQEAMTLRTLLNTDAARDFHVRRHLADAIRLQATATAVRQRTASARTEESVLASFQSLNTDWTTLAHELSTCSGISRQTQSCIERLNRLDQQYCQVLGIQTGFDRRQVLQAAYSLSAYCRDLSETLQVGGRVTGRNRTLQRKLTHLCEEVDYFAGLVSQQVQFETAVSEYAELYREWQQVEGLLNRQSDPAILRGIRRIRETHRTLHQLLRMTMQVDPEYVHDLVHELESQQRSLFQSITLEQMMALPDNDLIMVTASELAGAVENMDQLIIRNRNIQELAEAWGFIDHAWNRLAFYLEPIGDPRALAQLSATNDAVRSIQAALGITVEFDRTALLNMASSLEQLSDTLERALSQWQRRPGNHDRTLITKAHQMADIFHSIEQALATNRPTVNVSQCDQAIRLWQEIRPALKDCNTIEREQFDHLASTLTPELIRFRTQLGQ